ncbi:MAG: phospholipase [Actinomycetota bacterium]|nr:phospholipase [Actinomycetota bacterium]
MKAAGAAGALAATGGIKTLARAGTSSASALPATGADAPFDHVVVLCMENRSFDHYLSWVPGAAGSTQTNVPYLDDHGTAHYTHHLTEWQGCGFADPDHSVAGGKLQYNGGACDGFRKGENDDYALGYYLRNDLQTYRALVDGYTTFDHWFCSILGPTYPNRFYTHAAATDRLINNFDTSTLRTIWDNLAAAGKDARYYFSDLPFLGLWGPKYAPISHAFGRFFVDAAAGNLANYTYLDPFFLGEGQGGSNDDHPHADIRRGQALVSQVTRALQSSPNWSRTVFFVIYDEWGGFFDHVPPPQLPDLNGTPTADDPRGQAGFRIPAFVVSPFSPRGAVAGAQYDHTSILKLVEWRWGLDALTERDAAAANPAEVLDFDTVPPNLIPAVVPSVLDPGPHLCGSPEVGMTQFDPAWQRFKASSALAEFNRAQGGLPVGVR